VIKIVFTEFTEATSKLLMACRDVNETKNMARTRTKTKTVKE